MTDGVILSMNLKIKEMTKNHQNTQFCRNFLPDNSPLILYKRLMSGFWLSVRWYDTWTYIPNPFYTMKYLFHFKNIKKLKISIARRAHRCLINYDQRQIKKNEKF